MSLNETVDLLGRSVFYPPNVQLREIAAKVTARILENFLNHSSTKRLDTEYWKTWVSTKSPPFCHHFFPPRKASPLVLCWLLGWHVFLPQADNYPFLPLVLIGPSICCSKRTCFIFQPSTFQGPDVSFREVKPVLFSPHSTTLGTLPSTKNNGSVENPKLLKETNLWQHPFPSFMMMGGKKSRGSWFSLTFLSHMLKFNSKTQPKNRMIGRRSRLPYWRRNFFKAKTTRLFNYRFF